MQQLLLCHAQPTINFTYSLEHYLIIIMIISWCIKHQVFFCTATYKTDCASGASIPQPRGKHLWLLPGREALSHLRWQAACSQITLQRTYRDEMRGPALSGKGWAQKEEGATEELICASLLVPYMSAGSHYLSFLDYNSSLLLQFLNDHSAFFQFILLRPTLLCLWLVAFIGCVDEV